MSRSGGSARASLSRPPRRRTKASSTDPPAWTNGARCNIVSPISDADLEERIMRLRDALEYVRDRDAPTDGTYVGYAADIKRLAEVALATDDAYVEAAESA